MKKENRLNFNTPKHVLSVMERLEKASFEAYVVGGCVRDLLLGNVPKDWDIATNARPDDVQKIFPDSVYENNFGTVGIKIRSQESLSTGKQVVSSNQEAQKKEVTDVVEVTTYRIESKYSDKRHPDEVKFAKTLEEDLSRRDFTINALAIGVSEQKKIEKIAGTKFELIDLFSGQEDLENKLIRAVGDANERFNEDALRMMRAIRFSVTLELTIEKKTFLAIQKNSESLKLISAERIRDEFSKIILSSTPAKGIERLREAGILRIILPEIENGIGVTQSHHHYYGPYNT
ncbi:MAG: CCA tRNA nucleotidyltransferase, partial [Candidatus Moraniibacteriota bacterium]